ncbi:uncharacterized protein LOC144674952 [Cetorhinus maximus]
MEQKRLLENPYQCTNIVRGFFPPLVLPEPWDEVTTREKLASDWPSSAGVPLIPIALDGYIPNSVILYLLWPLGLSEILDTEPGSKVESELRLKVELKTQSKGESTENQISDTVTEHSSIFQDKLEAMEEELHKAEKQAGSNISVPVPAGGKEREVTKAMVSKDQLIRRRSSQVQKAPTPPPLPAFVTIFQGSDWFDKLFPEPNAKVFSSDLTEVAFAEMLIMILGTADYDVKDGIVRALVSLLQSQPTNLTTMAHDALITALNGPDPPGHQDKQQQNFIHTALWALKELTPNSQELLLELMVQYLQSDILARNTIKLLLAEVGLLDPHNFFEMELNSWLGFDEASVSTKENLRDLSSSWLRKWSQKFKEHVQTAMKSLKKGKTLRGSISIPQSATPSDGTPAMLSNSMEDTTIMVIPEKLQAGSLALLHPIEIVNYFCELQLQQQLNEMKAAEEKETERSQRDRGDLKNTVLFLPKDQRERAILRLGETSVTGGPIEKLHLPPIIPGSLSFGIGRFIKLSVPKINLNPFPSPIDHYPPEHVLITLRHSPQKYFILERSYVSNYACPPPQPPPLNPPPCSWR